MDRIRGSLPGEVLQCVAGPQPLSYSSRKGRKCLGKDLKLGRTLGYGPICESVCGGEDQVESRIKPERPCSGHSSLRYKGQRLVLTTRLGHACGHRLG